MEWTQVLKARVDGGNLAEPGKGCSIEFEKEFGTYGLLRRAYQDFQRYSKISVKALESIVLISNIV